MFKHHQVNLLARVLLLTFDSQIDTGAWKSSETITGAMITTFHKTI